MAIADEIGVIDTTSRAYLAKVDSYIGDLVTVCNGVSGGYSSGLIEALSKNTLTKTSPLNIQATSTSVESLFSELMATLDSHYNALDSFELPLDMFSLGNPLAGWVGTQTLELPTSLPINTNIESNDPLIAIIKDMLQALSNQDLLKVIENYLSYTSDNIHKVSDSYISGIVFGSEFVKAQVTAQHVLTNASNLSRYNEAQTNTRHTNFIIKSITHEYLPRVAKYSFDVDKLSTNLSTLYGELYVAIAEYIVNKGQKESSWFINDYEARLTAQSNNVQANNDLYVSYIENMMRTASEELRLNSEAIVTDFANKLKLIISSIAPKKLELSFNTAINEAAVSLFGMEIDKIIGASTTSLQTTLADKTNKIASYSTLVNGYRALLSNITQDAISIVQTKE